MDQNSEVVDLLHPLTTLEWEQCCEMPDGVYLTDVQAVVLGDMVYVGGWDTSVAYTRPGSLLIYDVTGNSWGKPIPTPTNYFALTTYKSKLVLVGGQYPEVGNKVTNELWVLNEQQKLDPYPDFLPAMKTARMDASAISEGIHLVVAGGYGGKNPSGIQMVEVDVVEVYNGRVWERVQSLPNPDSRMKSIFYEGNWFLSGRFQIYTSLDSLIATASSSSGTPDEQIQVWKKLTDLPLLHLSAPTMFGNQLVDIGEYSSSDSMGFSCSTSALHVFSPQSTQWMRVGDLPVACRSTCMLLLPTKELLVMVLEAECRNHPRHIFRGRVRVGPFQSGHISLRVLKRLHETAGIDIINQLDSRCHDFIKLVPKELPNLKNYESNPTKAVLAVFKEWNPTWGMLLIVLRVLSMDELAMKIERFFKTRFARSAIAGGILPIEDLGREEESDEHNIDEEEDEESEEEGESEKEEEGQSNLLENLFGELHLAMGTAGLEGEEEGKEVTTKLERLKGHIKEREEWLKDCESTVQSLMKLRMKDKQQIEMLRTEVYTLKKQLESVEQMKPEKRSMECDRNATADMKPRIAQLMRLKTTKGDRVNIMESIAPVWKKFGLLMDLDSNGQKVNHIEAEHAHKRNGQDICCQELFTLWLDGPDATWGNLIKLLVDSEHKELAEKVKDALVL